MLKYHKAIAANTDIFTAQSFVTSQEEIGLITIIIASGEDIFTKIRQLITEHQPTFFESEEPVAGRLQKYYSSIQDKLHLAEELQILTAAWREELSNLETKGSILYLTSCGNSQGFLFRDNRLTKLLQENESGQLISGHIKPGDRLLFTTSSLSQKFSEDQIKKLISLEPDELEDEIENYLQSHLDSDPVAAVSLIYQDDPPAKIEKETVAVPIQTPAFDGGELLLEKISVLMALKTLLKTFALNLTNFMFYRRRIRITAFILVTTLLFWGAFSYFKQSVNKDQQTKVSALLSQARERFEGAKSLKDTNSIEAKENLIQANAALEELLKISPADSQALELKEEILSSSKEILKVIEVADWPNFLDLSLIKKDFSADKLSLSVGKLLLLNTAQKTLVTLDLQKKTNQILAGQAQLSAAKFASINGDYAFVFSEDKGILRVDIPNQKVTVAAKTDPEWGQVQDLYAFAGNFYLLDITKNQIWKYVPVVSGYSDKTPYFKDGANIDLTASQRIQIDSSIWVLKSGSHLLKFTQGALDHFAITGLDKPLGDISAFFTSSDTENLYLLDQANSRLIVLNKKGEYLTQYQGDKFSSAKDFIVDETSKKLYLLENNIIYQVELR